MSKYRMKPIVVEATQFRRAKHFDGKHVTLEGVETILRGGEREFFVRTFSGVEVVRDGDYVITGATGERSTCKPDVFEAMYEPVMRPGEIGDEDG